MKIKNTDINIIQGDILSLNVEAIVNPAHPKLVMDEGLAKYIKEKGGKEIELEALSKAPLQPGKAVWTKAGGLKNKFIIHTTTVGVDRQTDQEIVRDAYANALKCADELKITSLAFPALGPPDGEAGCA